MAGYSGTPLANKLGIKPGNEVLLVGAPEGFRNQLAPIPEGVRFASRFSRTKAFDRYCRVQDHTALKMAKFYAETVSGGGINSNYFRQF